ncbi:hypothetical protein AQ611_19815 [Burkholderia singularis]|nr:hypothetical protein AQ611_19815 [Burkholderia sp. Bp7605]
MLQAGDVSHADDSSAKRAPMRRMYRLHGQNYACGVAFFDVCWMSGSHGRWVGAGEVFGMSEHIGVFDVLESPE